DAPGHYGVRHRYLPGWPPFEDPARRVYHPRRPLPGVYAISATHLQGVLLDDPATFAYFRAREPIAQIGYSIFVYQVPATGPPADLALGGVRLDHVPASVLDAHLGTNDLLLRWFDPATSMVIPTRSRICRVAVADDRPLAQPLATRFLDDPEPLVAGPGFRLYPCPAAADVSARLEVAAAAPVRHSPEVEFAPGEAPHLRLPVSLPASFAGQAAFLGYELLTPSAAPGEEVKLLSYWRVLEPPDHPLKIFVHLLDDHSHVWGQHDGLDVPVEGWQPGDVVVQLHTLAVDAGARPGRHWLQIGLYDPRTMKRLPIVDRDGAHMGERLLLSQIIMQ
ncbi:MAG: hypothetical protein DRI48_01690, partial [Chloroflexi bacterium]